MRAISDRYGVAQAVLLALQAGADIALWVTTDEVPAVLDRLEQAVERRRVDHRQAVDDAVMRVDGVQGPHPAVWR